VNGCGRALDVSAASGQGAEKSGHPRPVLSFSVRTASCLVSAGTGVLSTWVTPDVRRVRLLRPGRSTTSAPPPFGDFGHPPARLWVVRKIEEDGVGPLITCKRPQPEASSRAEPTHFFCSALRRARGSGDRVCRPAQATPLGHRKDRRGCRDQSAPGASSDVARRQEGDEAFGLRSRTPASSALTGCPVWLWVRAGTKSALPGSRRERTHPSPWRWRA
jgi:hypothetical protein